ncbi:MAG: serpin family protein [Deltaproteobacteria bacterium]|nr:MAG: serpin family protein [Deltaproteobacteria bacterium]
MTRLFALTSLAFLVACPSSDAEPHQPHPDRVARTVASAEGDIGVMVAGHNAFTWDLYAELVEDEPEKNAFFSPFSITSALGMTRAGARGQTAEQFREVLRVDGEDQAWHGALGALTRDLNGPLDRGYTLRVANRLFGQDSFPFEEDFLAICDEDYGAPLEPWDFISDPDGGRDHINAWVEEQTEGRIADLLPEDFVTSDTRLVLANAIYFYADWANAFERSETRDLPFTRLDGSTVTAPIMTMDLGAVRDHGIEAGWHEGISTLRLPYQDDELSMVLLIPNDASSLPSLEAELDDARFEAHLASLMPAEGVVGLPRLHIEDKRDLVPLLQDLGLVDAFDGGTADLTGIAPPVDGNLFLTGVVHQAFVMVDEEGTEAAAATGVGVGVESLPAEVIADKPFLFVIRDDLTGAILFVGRVLDPS